MCLLFVICKVAVHSSGAFLQMQATCAVSKIVVGSNTGIVSLINLANNLELDTNMDISKDKNTHKCTGLSGLLSTPCQLWHEGISILQSGRDSTQQATPRQGEPRIVSQCQFLIEKCSITKFQAGFPQQLSPKQGSTSPSKLSKKVGGAFSQAVVAWPSVR